MYEDFFNEHYFNEPWMEEALTQIIGVVLIVLGIALVIAVAFYVMQSLSVYTIAKRRGIRNPGLAWVPVAHNWVLGCISDQYKYVTKGQVTNRRTVMLALSVASVALSLVGGSLRVFLSGAGFLISVASWGVAIALVVFQYLALYDLYNSCDPNNSVVFLVLSILLAVTMPFFLLACRKKDKGMPPRKNPQPEYQPVNGPQHVPPQEPRWEPTQDRPEPWEQNPEE